MKVKNSVFVMDAMPLTWVWHAPKLEVKAAALRLKAFSTRHTVTAVAALASMLITAATITAVTPNSGMQNTVINKAAFSLNMFRPTKEAYVIAPVSIKKTPTPQVCAGREVRQHDDALLFAACPSFRLDFSRQADGPLNQQYFTPYIGAP